MRLALRLLVVLVALAMVLVAAVWFGGRSYLRKSVAQYAGTVAVPGPGAPIEVLFDARGVPQVYAKTDADARFALGWLHASERLFHPITERR